MMGSDPVLPSGRSSLPLIRLPRACQPSNALACSEPSSTHLTSHMSELAPLDPDLLADVLSMHPFVTIDGVCNVRDLGMVPVAVGEHVTRSGFRSPVTEASTASARC